MLRMQVECCTTDSIFSQDSKDPGIIRTGMIMKDRDWRGQDIKLPSENDRNLLFMSIMELRLSKQNQYKINPVHTLE